MPLFFLLFSHKEFIDKCKKDGVIINVGRTNQEVRDAGLIALAYDKRLKFKEIIN